MSLNEDRKCNTNTSVEAGCFIKLVTSFDFIASMVITRCLLDCTLDATRILQGRPNDIADGIHIVKPIDPMTLLMVFILLNQ